MSIELVLNTVIPAATSIFGVLVGGYLTRKATVTHAFDQKLTDSYVLFTRRYSELADAISKGPQNPSSEILALVSACEELKIFCDPRSADLLESIEREVLNWYKGTRHLDTLNRDFHSVQRLVREDIRSRYEQKDKNVLDKIIEKLRRGWIQLKDLLRCVR